MGTGIPARRRIQFLSAAFVLLLAVAAVVAVDTFTRRDAALAEQETVLEPMREQVNELAGGMVNQESAMLRYLLTEDEDFLVMYWAGQEAVNAAGEALQRLSAARPELLAGADAVVTAAQRWQEEVVVNLLALAEDGEFEEAADLIAEGHGAALFKDARDAVTDMRRALQRRQSEVNEAVQAARTRATILMYTILGGAILLALGTGALLRRWITRPLETIGTAVQRVVDGQLHHPIPATGPPDIAKLGRNVEEMRAVTVGLLDSAEQAREALQQHGTAVVMLREELQPSAATLPPSINVASAMHPAEGVLAGDWFDIVDRGDGHVVAAIVDVAGHGTGAGMLALRAKHLLMAAVRQRLQPGEALEWLAEHMGDTGERFLTCMLLDVELETGVCQYANAGHPPGVLLAPGRDPREPTVTLLEATGPLLGPLSARWTTERTSLPFHGLAILYTDGLVEARGDDTQFGLDRLIETVHPAHCGGPPQAVQRCIEEARRFAGGRFDDDVTVVALARGSANRTEPILSRAGAQEAI